MTAPEATTPARGPAPDYCPPYGGHEPHHMVSHSVPTAKLIRYVESCSLCGWIDGAALDRWAEQAHKEQLSRTAQNIAMAAGTEPFAFVQRPGEELTLREVLYQALGAASVCWVGGTGALEFDSARAKRIGEALEAEVNRFIRIDRQHAVSQAQRESLAG